MNILAIETSCDDTGIAVIKASGKKRPNFNVLSNIISSQIEIHKKWGGVYPMLAKREHQRNLTLVLNKALKNAGMLIKNQNSIKEVAEPDPRQTCRGSGSAKNFAEIVIKLEKILEREETLYEQLEKFLKKYQKPNIDLIAVTNGPGLEPCLWVGINFAKALSYYWDIPIISINHIEAHILVNFVNKNQNDKSKFKNNFPAVCLVVSGGHTQLILMKDIGKYKILGETRDDAAGECFDKTAKILGLEYPGGPIISKLASQHKNRISRAISRISPEGRAREARENSKFNINLPRPMLNTKDYDFSFSGLKTAVLYNFKKQPTKIKKDKKYIQEMAYETQQAIIDVLIKKTIKAVKNYGAETIILGGGVTANKELRKQLKLKIKNQESRINFLVPPKKLCTDNAVMIGIAGYYNQKKKTKNINKIEAKANLKL